jgi:hypothetical protein
VRCGYAWCCRRDGDDVRGPERANDSNSSYSPEAIGPLRCRVCKADRLSRAVALWSNSAVNQYFQRLPSKDAPRVGRVSRAVRAQINGRAIALDQPVVDHRHMSVAAIPSAGYVGSTQARTPGPPACAAIMSALKLVCCTWAAEAYARGSAQSACAIAVSARCWASPRASAAKPMRSAPHWPRRGSAQLVHLCQAAEAPAGGCTLSINTATTSMPLDRSDRIAFVPRA